MSVASVAGNVVRDPYIKVKDGMPNFARFTVAEDTFGKTEPTYVDCIVIGRLAAGVEKHVKKGSFIVVEGSLASGQYQKNGTTVYTRDVLVKRFRVYQAIKPSPAAKEAEEPESDSDEKPSGDGMDNYVIPDDVEYLYLNDQES